MAQVAFDAEELFHTPVLDQYPEIKTDYLKTVERPMDFSTIRNERMSSYRVISDLQNDLILVFRNCCTYHLPQSTYWKYAM